MRRVRPALALALVLAAPACKQEGAIEVRALTFTGVHAVSVSELKGALATRQSSRLPWGKKTYFDRSRFDADLKRIQAFYADRGYPDARVTGFDVKLNAKQDAVDVSVTISEGDPIKVASIEFKGFDVIPPEHLASLKSRIPLKVGEPRDRRLVVQSHELAVNELKDHGYPYAKVATGEQDAGPNGKEATVSFTAQPGILAHFGPIEIVGNTSVSDRVVERELTFKPGDLYQRSDVQQSQRRLYGLELFQFANIEPVDGEQQSPEVATRVTVAEGKHHRLNFGVGYGTEEKARVDAEYHHLNFLGGARTAGAHVRYSSLDRGIRIDVTQPYFFASRLSLSGEAQRWYTLTPAYQSYVTGVKATVTNRISERMSFSVSVQSEFDSSSIAPDALNDPSLRDDLIALGLNPETGEQNGTLNGFAFDAQRSTADSVLNARRGYQIALHAETAGEIMPGTFNYYAASADGRHYLSLTDRLVLASRLQLGTLVPRSDDPEQVPFSKKFFLGGSTSVRGWGRFELGPLSSSGLPIGGNSMLAFTEEIRATLRGNIGGVLFLDGGNVWASAWTFRLDDLRFAVGPGLRYQTPIGPIRFDWGYQLNPVPGLIINGEPQTRRWRLHFSIGQAF